MADFPLVSVIVPTHNRPDFLKKTLSSILNQTYTHLEVFVISNGVNALNKEVAENFNDPRITYVDQANSGGPSSPRNHGIRLSSGRYIAFCDDDDLWAPEKIEKQVKALENNPAYGLCYTKMMRFDAYREWSVPHEEGPADFHSLLYVNTIPISAVMIRRSLLDQFGGFSELKKVGASEDYEFLVRHAATTRFYFLDEYLIHYWSGNQRTTNHTQTCADAVVYLKDVFRCYELLWRAEKITISQLIGPSFHMLLSAFKIFAYQALVKLGLRK